MTRVLLAFDKFKDAVTADVACATVADVLHELHPTWHIEQAPLADGGEGFGRILTRAAAGTFIRAAGTGPRGARLSVEFGLVEAERIPLPARAQLSPPGSTLPATTIAVIEMAAISGLALLTATERDPWHTTTVGTGELIRAATAAGAGAILLGVGGSATNDLGLGALAALGLRFVDARGAAVDPIPHHWPKIVAIEGTVPAELPPIYIACDVTNPLLGPRGAAAVYGPQKGLRPEDFARLENEAARMANLLCDHAGHARELPATPGAGAAGGIAFGLMTAARARLVPGFALVAAWLDLERKLAAADIVVTGEGRFDASSLEGKGPGAVVREASVRGKPVHVFAGQAAVPPQAGLQVHVVTPPGQSLPEALANTPANLARAARRAFPR